MTSIGFGLIFTGQAHAGAWNQRAGEGQVISTSSWSQAKQIFDDNYEAETLTGFSKTESRIYIEQGLTNWLTLVGNGGVQTLNFKDGESQFDFEGLDDIELGVQIKVYARENKVGSIRLSYVVDGSLDNQVVGLFRSGDQYEFRALIGQSRETIMGDLFYDAQLAIRTEAFRQLDGLQTALTLGYKPTARWLLMSQSFLNFSDEEKFDGFDVPEQTQLVSQVSIARQYKPGRYVQLGAGKALLGQNIVKERSVFIGVWTEY